MVNNIHKVISLNYTLTKDDTNGELIETSEGKTPLVFLTGFGQMIPDFENNVAALNNGDSFAFGIKAADAYGERTEEAIIPLNLEMFKKDGVVMEGLVLGATIPLQDPDGRVIPGKVIDMADETVTMDMNHPLANQDLFFKGSIVSVREGTANEIDHGHVHGEGGHQH